MAVMSNLVILGFGLRVQVIGLQKAWTYTRRLSHLVDPRTASPLSIDEASWPPPLDVDERYKLVVDSRKENADFYENGIGLMSAIPNDWIRLDADSPLAIGSSGNLIAATCHLNDVDMILERHDQLLSPSFTEASVRTVLQTWNSLGYDLIDANGISILTNCGLGEYFAKRGNESEVREAQGMLNLFGLLKSRAEALRFIAQYDIHFEDHSPTIVCGLAVRGSLC